MTTDLQVRKRIISIDVLRGIIMVIMALDHVHDFFHVTAMTDVPTNMVTTSPWLFFTRWITHFCAPVFLFLSGMSAFLGAQKKTKKELSLFLLKRGCWLIVLEIVIMNFILTFNPSYNFVLLGVIWVFGVCMILLALLIQLPYRLLLSLGLVIFFAHNLLDIPEAARDGKINLFWSFVHGRNAFLNLDGSHFVLMAYSFLPWLGLMILGYCTGKLFLPQVEALQRKKILMRIGIGLILLFIVVRFINIYGDPVPWSVQRNNITSFLSFLNLTKYPPSLLFCCMTLGPALILLALLENINNKATAFFNVYGRVPLFYFIVHFLFIHLLCVILFFWSGHSFKDAYGGQGEIFGFRPVQFGYPLLGVYLIWIFIVLLLFPLCKKYDRYKSTHRQWWLSYL